MVAFLAKIFIKDSKNLQSVEVRRKYGVLLGGMGIFFNALLFGLKLTVGIISGSVAVIADAVNNISDAGSSLISMIGFRLAGKKPDPDHPFGHGRMEYIAGFIVSILIFIMGFELASDAVNAIAEPVKTKLTVVSAVILGASVAIKLYMFAYNRYWGKKLNSPTMKATAADSLGDTVSTLAVIGSLAVTQYTDYIIDGYVGMLVAVFILIAGFRAAKETIEPLLGTRPDKELIDELEKLVLSRPPVTGVHDLILHDYGPGRQFLSLHAEVPMDEDILFVHDVVDNIEFEIYEKYGIETVIHMDPIDTRNSLLNDIKITVKNILDGLNEGMSCHDFRIVPGNTHTNVVFDIAIPADCKTDPEALKLAVSAAVAAMNPTFRCVIKIDRNYS